MDLQFVRVNLGLLLGGDLEGGGFRNCSYVSVILNNYLVRLLQSIISGFDQSL